MKRLIIKKVLITSQNSKTGKFALYFFSYQDLRADLMLIRMTGQHPEVSGPVEFTGNVLVKDFTKKYPKENKKLIRDYLKTHEFGYLVLEE